jgi:sugar phosphate isomerase/epimerase
MTAAMRDRGVSIGLGEGFSIRPGVGARDRAADLDLLCELGASRINTVGLDPDMSRCLDEIGVLVELAGAVGVETTLEFGPGLSVADLPTALAAVRHVARPDFRLLIDTMHFVRSGSTAADILALDPDLIGYVQLSDAPLKPTNPNYMDEAMFERLAPTTGELPLLDIIAALPRDRLISLEVPQRALAERGVSPRERLSHCLAGAQALRARAAAQVPDSL